MVREFAHSRGGSVAVSLVPWSMIELACQMVGYSGGPDLVPAGKQYKYIGMIAVRSNRRTVISPTRLVGSSTDMQVRGHRYWVVMGGTLAGSHGEKVTVICGVHGDM